MEESLEVFDDVGGLWTVPAGNLGEKLLNILMRIEDRCDKVSNELTHVQEQTMRLVYREHEVIRICSQHIIEADNPNGVRA